MLAFKVLSALLVALTVTASPLVKRAPANLPVSVVSNAYSNGLSRRGTNLTVWGMEDAYSIDVFLGTPPKKVGVQLDTGSTLLWVKDFDSDDGLNPGSTWRSINSSTFVPTLNSTGQPSTYDQRYGKGEMWGQYGQETVRVGDHQIEHQQIGATHKWTADFDDYYGVEGLIGLAWPRQGEEPPFWMKLLGQWSEKVIGMYLGRAPEGSNSDSPAPGGMVTFGGTDRTFYNGEVHYVPRKIYPTLESHWTIPLDGVKANGKQVVGPGRAAIIDSGTSIIVGPKNDVDAYYAQIPGSQAVREGNSDYYLYQFPCDAPLPKVAFTFGGVDFPISDIDINRNGNGPCTGGVAAWTSYPFWVVGDTFMKNYYTAYRVEPAAIGFAPIKPELNVRPQPEQPVEGSDE